MEHLLLSRAIKGGLSKVRGKSYEKEETRKADTTKQSSYPGRKDERS